MEVTKWLKPSISVSRIGDSASVQAVTSWHKKSIAKLSGSELPKRDPQIEAVCADGIGRILLLQENPQRAELIDLKSLEAVALIDLVVEGREWTTSASLCRISLRLHGALSPWRTRWCEGR
jgi:hypothetical protein